MIARLILPPPPQQIDQWHQALQGWAAGLKLTLLAHQNNAPYDGTALVQQPYLQDYFNEQFFRPLSRADRHFLQCCSLLRQLNENVIQALTGDKHPAYRLKKYYQQGLLERCGEDYALFAPYRAFLQQQPLPQKQAHYHKLAAQAWLETGHFENALYHTAKYNGDNALICHILLKAGWPLFHQGKLALLEQNLTHLSGEILEQYPELILLCAWLAQSQHGKDEVQKILTRFAHILPHKLNAEQAAEFEVLNAQIAINQGNEEQALTLAQKALQQLSPQAHYARTIAVTIMGEVYHCRSQFEQAIDYLQQAEKMANKYQTLHHILWSYVQQAEIFVERGFLQAGFDILEKAHQFVLKHQLQTVPMFEFVLRLKGKILYQWAKFDEAEQAADLGLRLLGEKKRKLHCLVLKTHLALLQNNMPQVKENISKIKALQSSHFYHIDAIAQADQVKLAYWQATSNVDEIGLWLSNAYLPATENNRFGQLQWRNLAKAHFFLGNTNKALSICEHLQRTATQHQLQGELTATLMLQFAIYSQQKNTAKAIECLCHALSLSHKSQIIAPFLKYHTLLLPLLPKLLLTKTFDDTQTQQAKIILQHLNHHKTLHAPDFNKETIQQILAHPSVPMLLKMNPLTEREWQVLALIYAGFTNEQIAIEFAVAASTIKSHIRNLYSKLCIRQRSEAVNFVKPLLKLLGD